MAKPQKILQGQTTLLWDFPFFGVLFTGMECIERDDIPTMATDGVNLFYNTDFMNSLSKAELVFVLAHEVLHVAFEHHLRRKERHPVIWNIACDYVINLELSTVTGIKMPKGGLLDKQYEGMGAEEVYRLIYEDLKKKAEAMSADSGGCGGVMDAADVSAAGIEAQRADIQTRIRQAANVARAAKAGTMPASMERLLKRLTEAVVDWRAILRQFIDESSSKDYSWSKPNRRYLGQNYILPGLVADGISHLVVAVDTSGSINGEILNAFASEIDGAFGDGSIDKVTVIYADAKVAKVEEYERGDDLRLIPAGGGGTDFADTLRWIDDNASDASAIIYFTDLETCDFGKEPSAPVLWGFWGNAQRCEQLSAKVPFGRTIHIKP
jgi:predicted metal-dependent peptidase